MKILHVIASVDPKGGGPVEGVRQRGLRLLHRGHQVEVASVDDPRSSFVSTYGLPVHALGPPISGYRYSRRLVPWLKSHAGDYDAVVVNGLWQYHSFAAWRALRGRVPYYVFCHGMLDPWFKHTYPLKHAKKWLYWPWADYRVLRDAQAVLFTSEEERLRARESFWLYRGKEKVVAYGTSSPPLEAQQYREHFWTAHPNLRGKRIALFLGRIHEKKGCDLLIRAFSAAADQNMHLVMAGPDDNSWVSNLKQLSEQIGIADRVTWAGMLQGNLKWGAFYASEVFALPSHQENFGIAVAEALACGLPVLISDKVNIWREVQADGAGLVGADTARGTEDTLRQWIGLSSGEQQAMRERARSCFDRRFTIDAMADSLLDVVGQYSGVPA